MWEGVASAFLNTHTLWKHKVSWGEGEVGWYSGLHSHELEARWCLIERLLDQFDQGELVFMPAVNLYYETDLRWQLLDRL